MYALQNQVRAAYGRELDAISRRKRSRLFDPRAACGAEFRPFEKWERIARAEEAQRVVDVVLRDKLWAPDRRLDQWVEKVYCMHVGMLPVLMGASIPLGPIDALGGSSTILGYLIAADSTVTIATGVSQWTATIGSTTFDYAQATGGAQPTYTANDGTLWGRPTITGDGTADFMTNTWDPPAPGTTPAWFRYVFKAITWLTNKRLIGGFGQCIQVTASPQMRCTNGTNGGTLSPTLGTWYRGETLFNNSTTDYFKVGTATDTGTNLGNTNVAANAVQLFAGGGANFGNMAIQKLLICNANPTALQKALLDGIDTRFYNGNITL